MDRPGEGWAPLDLLAKDMLHMYKYLSGFQPKYVEEIGHMPINGTDNDAILNFTVSHNKRERGGALLKRQLCLKGYAVQSNCLNRKKM